MFVDGTHPVAGPISYVGSVAIIDGAPFVVRRHASAPGDYTNEIVGELEWGRASGSHSTLKEAGVGLR